MDRKDLDRPEYGSYEEVHEMLVRAMQDACMNDTSREYEPPQIDMSFLYEDEKTKKTMAYRVIRSVAILFLAFGMLLGINAVLLTSDSNDVYGEKGLLHRIHEGVRGIFTDEDPSQYVEVDETGEVFIITDMKDIDKAKAFWPELCVPEYLPEDYALKRLKIDKSISDEYNAQYDFYLNEDVIEINISYTKNNNVISAYSGDMIETNDRKISIYKEDRYNLYIADVYFEHYIVNVYGKSREYVFNIACGIK